MNHNNFMKLALNLAKKGMGFTSPNPMVGAILVKNKKIIGKGYHKKIGSNHAEIEAINQAGSLSKGATLYVTLEPCNHFGKTPPCTKRIIEAGIIHVVFAMKDPNKNISGGGEEFLNQNGIKTTSNICKREANDLNEFFIKHAKTGLPFVIAKCASTLDGRIATRTGNSKWITGYKARQFAHRIRHSVDGIIVGKNTILNDNPSLTTRLKNKQGSDPARIILDTNLSISKTAKVITQTSNAKTYIITGKNINPNKEKFIANLGISIISLPKKNKKIDLKKLMQVLGNMGFNSILVEGGGEVMASMLSYKLVDKICFFYAPKILTGNDGIPICSGLGPSSIDESIPIQNMTVHQIGEDLMIQGYIKKMNC